jgi:phage baseplate assembly protein W
LKKTIKYTIEKYEPRAQIANITIKANHDANAYEVLIVYLPDNDTKEASLEVYLERT